MEKELVVVIDFGGQYNQLVARRVRECNVYCEIYSYKTDLNKIKAMNPKGIILTGGPASCYEPGAAACSEDLFNLGVPVLGLCYGAQLMTHVLGGKVERAAVREYGKTEVKVDRSSKLFSDVSENTICWMSHFDYISKLAPGFRAVATTANCPVAAAECVERGLYAIQFRKYFTPWKAPRCCIISYVIFADAAVTGRWILSWKSPLRQFVRRLVMVKSSVHCPAVWIPPWQQYCYPRQSVSS